MAAVPVMACVNGGHCFPLGTAVAIPATHVSFQIRSSCQRHVSAHIQQLVFGRMCVSRLAIVFPLLYFFLVSPSLPRIVLPVSSSPPASWTDTAAASPATSSAAAAAAAAATTTTTTTTNTTTTNCSYAQDHHTCHQDRGLQLLNTAPARRLRRCRGFGASYLLRCYRCSTRNVSHAFGCLSNGDHSTEAQAAHGISQNFL